MPYIWIFLAFLAIRVKEFIQIESKLTSVLRKMPLPPYWFQVFINVVHCLYPVKQNFRVTTNPLQASIRMHILHPVLYTFCKVLTRRIIRLRIKSVFSWWSFPLFSWPYSVIWGWYRKEKLSVNDLKLLGEIWC